MHISPASSFWVDSAESGVIDSDGVYLRRANFYHLDHLGSTEVITNMSSAPIGQLAYYPFGCPRNDSALGEYAMRAFYQYTAKEQHSESSLHYFEARYYNAAVGRFVSTDPAGLERIAQLIGTPQLLNGYSYAANRPIVARDPDGEILNFVIGGAAGAIVDAAGQIASNLASGKSALDSFSVPSVLASAVLGVATSGGSALAGSGVKFVAKELGKAVVRESRNTAAQKVTAMGASSAARKAGADERSAEIVGAGASALTGGWSSTKSIIKNGPDALRQNLGEITSWVRTTVENFRSAASKLTYGEARNRVLGPGTAGPISEGSFESAQNLGKAQGPVEDK